MRNIQVRWEFPPATDIPGSFAEAVGGDPLIAALLYRRGITTLPQARPFLDPDHYRPTSGSQLPGFDRAVERLQQALVSGETVLVWGDFDVDGQTSTSLLVSGLRELGGEVVYYIPHRLKESHGLDINRLQFLIEKYHPQVILTCDTGVDAVEPVALANQSGVDVIITDHHQLPPALPAAHAIVNPQFTDPDHSLYTLPGVGVAYKLIEALFEQHQKSPENYLDLTALGIVADLAELAGDTRYLLQRGLSILQDTHRPGLLSLCKKAGINPADITEEQIGYVIGPRLNALGRLSDANPSVEFLTTSDPVRAASLAETLELLNVQRQQLTDEIFQSALELIDRFPDLVEDYSALILSDPAWHAGVIGIVASRLVDRFHKPVILLKEEGESARGSARSVPGVPIASLIASLSNMLESHGGHPMAAGLSLPLVNVPDFRRGLSRAIQDHVGAELPPPVLQIDAVIDLSKISLSFIEDLHRLAPFGPGNPPPLFATQDLKLLDEKLIGKHQAHRKLTVADSTGTSQQMLWWNSADYPLPEIPFQAAYSLRVSTYRGSRSPQVTVRRIRTTRDHAPALSPQERSSREIIDCRFVTDPHSTLENILRKSPDLQIWVEGPPENLPAGTGRDRLAAAETLAVWTTPPSARLLQQSVQKVDPGKVYLFANDPRTKSPQQFLEYILGLLKYACRSEKLFTPLDLSIETAQTETAVLAALDWIEHRGDFLLGQQGKQLAVKKGPGTRSDHLSQVERKLHRVLRENFSYRFHYKNAKKENLL